MSNRRAIAATIIAVAGATAAAVLAGAWGGSTDTPGTQPTDGLPGGLPGFTSYQPIAGCVEDLPAAIEEPEFRPESLPLPAGSEAVKTLSDPAPGLHVVIYTVPTSLNAFVDHVLETWPANGWELGRGEREVGEAEGVFYLSDKSRYGQFRARQIYCDEAIELTLTIGEDVREPNGRRSTAP